MAAKYEHQTVLLKEAIEYLQPKPNQNFVDGTLGGGGHTEALLEATGPRGHVLAFELDKRAIQETSKRLKQYKDRLHIVNSNYANLKTILGQNSLFKQVQGIILDLGLSADQLINVNRGFSFKDQGPLDMRFDPENQALTASDIVLTWSETELNKIFREYGEEPQAQRLARGIVKYRSSFKQKQKFLGTSMLVYAILQILNIQEKDLPKFRIHPATKAFQALRIAVNDELGNISAFLPQAVEALSVGGRLSIISFHSLEDRIVKNYFKKESIDCHCPPELPVCVCNHKASLKIITKKGIKPSLEETRKNPRSRSAIMRTAEKI